MTALHYHGKHLKKERPLSLPDLPSGPWQDIWLWPVCRRWEEFKRLWMRPQMLILAYHAWLQGGLGIIPCCDICQWVQGLAASRCSQLGVPNQHNITSVPEPSTGRGSPTAPASSTTRAKLRPRSTAKSQCPNATEANDAAFYQVRIERHDR